MDVVWSEPKGDRLAILTEKGTIHIHELPASAFQWPPLRRTRISAHSVNPQNSNAASDRTATKSWKGAVSSGMQAVNGTLAAARSRSASQGSRFPLPTLSSLSITPAVGAKGGKAVAAGLIHSLGAATDSVNQVWHARDNKLDIHSLTTGIVPGRMRWLTGRERGSIAVVAGGAVHAYPVKRSTITTASKKSVTTLVVTKDKALAFDIPGILDLAFPPTLLASADIAKRSEHTTNDTRSKDDTTTTTATSKPDDHNQNVSTLYGIWKFRASPAAARTSQPPFLSHAEIDTNPPYQPFHTDRRVNLFAYTAPTPPPTHDDDTATATAANEQNMHHINDSSAWVFGGDIPATRIPVGSALADEDEDEEAEEAGMGVESLVQERRGDGEGVERIVVTTRRRGRRQQEEEVEGIFEDDCEVLEWAEDRV